MHDLLKRELFDQVHEPTQTPSERPHKMKGHLGPLAQSTEKGVLLEKQHFGLPYRLGVRRIVAAVERGQLGYGVVGMLNHKDHLAPRLRREHEKLDLPRRHDVKPLRLLACQEEHPAPAYIILNASLEINLFCPPFGLVAGFCRGIFITLITAFVVTGHHPLASYCQAHPLILSFIVGHTVYGMTVIFFQNQFLQLLAS